MRTVRENWMEEEVSKVREERDKSSGGELSVLENKNTRHPVLRFLWSFYSRVEFYYWTR